MADEVKRSKRGGKRPGPKPIALEERRRNRIMLNFTDAESQSLTDAAGDENPATFARTIVLRYLARLKK